jgi:hydrogenase nickel incorporation protein HypB
MQRALIETKILTKNDEYADENRACFRKLGLLAVNFMSAPGAGKTTVLENSIRRLTDRFRLAVIEGDLETELDADRIRALGIPAHQITTGTCCHLDAKMIARAIQAFPLDNLDAVLIENVGNMVCPAEFDLGEHLRVMVFSVPEGAEKPKKYPLMFHQAHAVILNKIDLLPHSGVSLDELTRNVREVNPRAALFPLSCRTGKGLDSWLGWLTGALEAHREQRAVRVGA